MTKTEFESLRATANEFGDTLGVSATLFWGSADLASFSPSGRRIRIRVVRFVPGQSAREYSPARVYRPDAKNLKQRILADIKLAAERLLAVRGDRARTL